MPGRSGWELTPQQSISLECARRGHDRLVDGCIALLEGREVDDNLIIALGGPAAQTVLNDGPRQRNQYWRRVWAARGLLHAWDARAQDAIIAASTDEHWRVREMAAKVIAAHTVDAGLEAVADLRSDPVPRVRAAAERATVLLTAPRR
jgi:HEAT repeats